MRIRAIDWLRGLVNGVCAYPLIPWLSMMMLGWVLGRWLLEERDPATRVRALLAGGLVLLVLFGLVRGIDLYGNWNLHRDSPGVLQWLHVAKYPPSLAYTTLELGSGLLLLALFGATAFFYYLLHVHLMLLTETLLKLDTSKQGLAKTWLASLLALAVLAGPCWFYRRYKAAHPDGWARYI